MHSFIDTWNHKAKTSQTKHKHFEDYNLTLFPFLLLYVTASCLFRDVGQRGREFTPEMAFPSPLILLGSSEGCCLDGDRQWVRLELRQQVRPGRGVSGGCEARGGHEVLLSGPPVLPSGNSTGHMGAHGAVGAVGWPDKQGCRHIFCVYMGSMKCTFVRAYTCVCVCPCCLPWVFVAGFYLGTFWGDILHPRAA